MSIASKNEPKAATQADELSEGGRQAAITGNRFRLEAEGLFLARGLKHPVLKRIADKRSVRMRLLQIQRTSQVFSLLVLTKIRFSSDRVQRFDAY